MLTLKRLAPLVALFLTSCIIIPTYKARISLKPTHINEEPIQVNTMLLIGTGTVASRMFLDNLSTTMLPTFKKKGVQAEFSYIGKVPEAAHLKMDSLTTAPYDAYLVFRASDDSYLDMSKVKYTGFGPGVTTAGYGNQFADTYTISLYAKKDGLQLVWQSALDVDFDLANDNRYKQISQLIFKELAKNRILSN